MKAIKVLLSVTTAFLLLSVHSLKAQSDQINLGTFNMNEQHLDIEKKAPSVQAAGVSNLKAIKNPKTGKPIGANEMVQIPEGKSMTAAAYFAELEKLDREFKAKGYSLENDPEQNTVGKVKVNEAELTRQRASQAASGKFISEKDIQNTFKSANMFNGKELKSLDAMTDADFNAMKTSKTRITTGAASGDLQGTELKMSTTPITAAAAAPGALVKSINQNATKSWSYGSTSSFHASITGTVNINGKVYQPAGNLSQMTLAQAKAELAKTNSEFNYTSSGRVDGTLFGKAFNVLNVSSKTRVPANSTQQINLGMNVSVVGINIYNLNQNYAQSFNLSGSKSAYKEIRYSYTTIIVVVPITGAIGVKGTVGVNYGISGDKQSLVAGVTPFASLAGFVEASINAGLVKAGVTGTITFVNGNIPLQGQLVLSVNNGIVINELLYAGYNLNFLAGTVKLFAKVWVIYRWKYYYYTVWSTNGFNVSGNFANYKNASVIAW